jgi:hypothetical protein
MTLYLVKMYVILAASAILEELPGFLAGIAAAVLYHRFHRKR